MVLGDCQADFGFILEPTVFCEEVDVGRLEWVFEWEDDLTVVDPFMKIGVPRPEDREVPYEHVVF